MGIALQPAHQRARTVVSPASYHTDSVCRSLIHDSVRWLTPSHMTQEKSCLHTIYHPNLFFFFFASVNNEIILQLRVSNRN